MISHKIGSKIFLILMIIFIAVSSISGCSEKKKVTAVFDVDHKPVFKQYSTLRGIFERSGIEMINGGIRDLEKADTYILAGPAHRVDEQEIVEFVRNGGVLVIFIHIPPTNIKPILDEFGMNAESEPIEENIVVGVPVENNVLTDNVDKIVLYGAFRVSHPIIVEKRGEIRFSNTNQMGIVGFKKFEKGYVIVIGDDAGFIDQYIESGDNKILIKNLAEFIKNYRN